MKIESLIARRTDLSTFLVHLTRAEGEETAKQRLTKMLVAGRICARNPFGPAVERLRKRQSPTDSQNCVCFTETPLEHTNLLIGDIEGRKCHLEPYGIAITKMQARKRGANPVWYLDITPGHDWLTVPLERMVDDAIKAEDYGNPIFKITPFIEQMGAGQREGADRKYQKEFWWEREWRHVGDFSLPLKVIALCPSSDIGEIRRAIEEIPETDRMAEPAFVDPSWSLEKMIGRLAGISMEDLGPF